MSTGITWHTAGAGTGIGLRGANLAHAHRRRSVRCCCSANAVKLICAAWQTLPGRVPAAAPGSTKNYFCGKLELGHRRPVDNSRRRPGRQTDVQHWRMSKPAAALFDPTYTTALCQRSRSDSLIGANGVLISYAVRLTSHCRSHNQGDARPASREASLEGARPFEWLLPRLSSPPAPLYLSCNESARSASADSGATGGTRPASWGPSRARIAAG